MEPPPPPKKSGGFCSYGGDFPGDFKRGIIKERERQDIIQALIDAISYNEELIEAHIIPDTNGELNIIKGSKGFIYKVEQQIKRWKRLKKRMEEKSS